jgi:hypothetical protein
MIKARRPSTGHHHPQRPAKTGDDIHIEPTDGSTEVKYRIDGILYLAMEPLDIKFHSALISRLKVMSVDMPSAACRRTGDSSCSWTNASWTSGLNPAERVRRIRGDPYLAEKNSPRFEASIRSA